MEKELERLIELTCFRAESRLHATIGPEFNNETLMLVNAVSKSRASIDLEMGAGSDAGHGIILTKGEEGFPLPLDLVLTRLMRKLEFQLLDGEDADVLESFLRGPAGLSSGDIADMEKEIAAIERRALMTGRNKMDRALWQAAKRYHLMMTSPVLDFEHRDLLARLYLYRDMIRYDERLSGMNIEQALLIRREDHDRVLSQGKLDQIALLISECMLESIYSGADRLEIAARSADAATLYLAERIEKGRPYTMTEMAEVLGLPADMTATLFVLPALTGDRISVEPSAKGEDRYTLIQ